MGKSRLEKLDSSLLEQLFLKIAEHDEESFKKLYELIKAPVYGYSLSILKNKDDALDNLQDTLVKIYEQIEKYNYYGKPMNWIFTITKNLALMKIRKSKDLTNDLDYENISSSNQEENQIILKVLMEQLSLEERNIILMHLVWGFKHREISEILDINVSTIISKYNRAIKKLQKMEEIK